MEEFQHCRIRIRLNSIIITKDRIYCRISIPEYGEWYKKWGRKKRHVKFNCSYEPKLGESIIIRANGIEATMTFTAIEWQHPDKLHAHFLEDSHGFSLYPLETRDITFSAYTHYS